MNNNNNLFNRQGNVNLLGTNTQNNYNNTSNNTQQNNLFNNMNSNNQGNMNNILFNQNRNNNPLNNNNINQGQRMSQGLANGQSNQNVTNINNLIRRNIPNTTQNNQISGNPGINILNPQQTQNNVQTNNMMNQNQNNILNTNINNITSNTNNVFNNARYIIGQQNEQNNLNNNLGSNINNNMGNLISNNNQNLNSNPNNNNSNNLINITNFQSSSLSNASYTLPQGQPKIMDSLFQKNSFTQIEEKLKRSSLAINLLTEQQKDFIKLGNFLYFQPDQYKKKVFDQKIIPHSTLNFGKEQMPISVNNTRNVNKIFIQLIKDFSKVTGTNQMNGYFILRQYVRVKKMYKFFYKPKPNFDNKVWEENTQILKQFITNFDQNTNPSVSNIANTRPQTINKGNRKYLKLLSQLVQIYYDEYYSLFSIIYYIIEYQVQFQKYQQRILRSEQQQQFKNIHQRMKLHKKGLKFKDLVQYNIMKQLWRLYKCYSFSNYLNYKIQNDALKQINQQVLTKKKGLFYKFISPLIICILKYKYNQLDILQKNPFPIIQVIKYINNDINISVDNDLIQKNLQGEYKNQALNLLFNLIPFSAFIKNQQIISIHFNQQFVKQKFIYLGNNIKKQIINQIIKLKDIIFFPLKYFGQYEKSVIQNYNNQVPFDTQIWEDAIQSKILNINSINGGKYWYCWFISIINKMELTNRPYIKSFLPYVCKKLIKDQAQKFINLWNKIFDIKQRKQNQRRLVQQQIYYQSQQYKLTQYIIKSLDLYLIGRYIISSFTLNRYDQGLRIMTKIIKQINPQKNIKDQRRMAFFSKFMKQIQKYNNNIHPLTIISTSISNYYMIPVSYLFNNDNELSFNISLNNNKNYFQQQIKFLCQLIKKSIKNLHQLEKYLFYKPIEGLYVSQNLRQQKKRKYFQSQYSGLKTCTLIMFLLKNSIRFDVTYIRSLRYLISVIDVLFNNQKTLLYIIRLMSIFFPLNPTQYQIQQQNKDQNKNKNMNVQKLIQMILQLKNNSYVPQIGKQLKKLQQIISFHLNNIIKHSDKINQYFTVNNQDIDQYNVQLYNNIYKDLKQWNFNNIYLLIYNKQPIRSTQWLMNISQLLKQKQQISPINLDNIIELIKKMRIKSSNKQSYIYIIMDYFAVILNQPLKRNINNRHNNTLLNQFNQQNKLNKPNYHMLTKQIIQILRPCVRRQQKKGTLDIHSDYVDVNMNKFQNKLKSIIPTFYQQNRQTANNDMGPTRTITTINSYNKYCDVTYCQNKKKKLRQKHYKNLIRKIYLTLKLIELIFQLKLQNKQQYNINYIQRLQIQGQNNNNNNKYQIFEQLTFVNEIYSILSQKQKIYKYQISYQQNNYIYKKQINIIFIILNFCELSQKYNYISSIQTRNFHNIEQQMIKVFQLIQPANNQISNMYCTNKEFIQIEFFQNLLYNSANFSQNPDKSFNGIIINIVKLMTQNGYGNLVYQCLSSEQYPVHSNHLIKLQSNIFRRYFPSQPTNHNMNNIDSFFYKIQYIINNNKHTTNDIITKMFQTLYVLLNDTYFCQKIVQCYNNWFYYIDQILSLFIRQCKKIQKLTDQINIVNKICLFIHRFMIKFKIIFNEQVFKNEIIKKYFNNYSSILNKIFKYLQNVAYMFAKIDQLVFCNSKQMYTNYLMQRALYRHTIYRSNFYIALRIFQMVFQYLHPQDTKNHINFLINLNIQSLILKKPNILKQQIKYIKELNIIANDFLTFQQSQNKLKLLKFSDSLINFKYCQSSNINKFGPNFLYNTFQVFNLYHTNRRHRSYSSRVGSEQNQFISKRNKLRCQIFYLKLINCTKSLQFSAQVLSQTYLSILTLSMNLGLSGQILSNVQLDLKLPSNYVEQINSLIKYQIKSKYTIISDLISYPKKNAYQINLINKQISITHILQFVRQLFQYVRIQPNKSQQILFSQNNQNERINIFRNFNSLQNQNVTIVGQQLRCLNFQNVLMLIFNISNKFPLIIEQLNYTMITDVITNIFKIYQKIIEVIKEQRIYFTLSLTLLLFDNCVDVLGKIIQIQSKRTANFDKKHYDKIHYENKKKQREQKYWYLQNQILNYIRMLFSNYEVKHRQIHLNRQMNFPKIIDVSKDFTYSEQNILSNIDIISTICKKIITNIQQKQSDINKMKKIKLLNTNPNTQILFYYQNSFRSINMLIEIFIDNYFKFESEFQRYTLIQLCNHFYCVLQKKQIINEYFCMKHLRICKNVLFQNQNKLQKRASLEKLAIFDTYNILSNLIPQNLNQQLIKSLCRMIVPNFKVIKHNSYNKREYQNSIRQSNNYIDQGHDSQNQTQFQTNHCDNNFYELRKYKIFQLSLDQLLEFKKITYLLLNINNNQQWNSQIYKQHLNQIFIQIIHLGSLEFNFNKLNPYKKIDHLLKRIIVFTDIKQIQIQRNKNQIKCLSQLQNRQNINYSNRIQVQQTHIIRPRINVQKKQFEGRISLFEFIGFVQYSQIIYNYLIILRIGFQKSNYMKKNLNLADKPLVYNQIWNKINQHMETIVNYFLKMTKIFVQNKKMSQNLIKLYNYISQEPSFLIQPKNEQMNKIQNLQLLNKLRKQQEEQKTTTLLYEKIDQNFINQIMIKSIYQYCHCLVLICRKWKNNQWKSKDFNWRQHRIKLLEKFKVLLHKNSTQNIFQQHQIKLKHQHQNNIRNGIISQNQFYKQKQYWIQMNKIIHKQLKNQQAQ